MIFHIFCSLAEFERELTSERTKAGLAAARINGHHGGRPKGLSKEAEKIARIAETLYREGKYPIEEMARQLGLSKVTLYKYLKIRGISFGPVSVNRAVVSCE